MELKLCTASLLAHLAALAKEYPNLPVEFKSRGTTTWSDEFWGRARGPSTARRGYERRWEARIVEYECDREGNGAVKVEIPSSRDPSRMHVVTLKWSPLYPLEYACTCEWSEHHFYPCHHVYAAVYRLIEEVEIEEGTVEEVVVDKIMVPKALMVAAYAMWRQSSLMPR